MYYYQRIKLKENVREARGKIYESVSQSGLGGIFVDVKFDSRFTSSVMWDGSPEET